MSNKKLSQYKAVLFDMDGTLYSQPKLRLSMAGELFFYFFRHPLHLKELFILMEYRRCREHWNTDASYHGVSLEEEQYLFTAKRRKTSPEQVKEIITRWMHTHPLSLLPKCRDHQLAAVIHELQKQSVITAVYSDYPAAAKLKALDIQTDYIFCSSDPDINCMKPNPKAMTVILKKLDISAEDAIMIGDRYSKDGLAAKNAGMDYIILPKSIPARSSIIKSLL